MFSASIAAISSAILASYMTFLLMTFRQEKEAKKNVFSRATIFEQSDDESFLRIFKASKFEVTFSDDDMPQRKMIVHDEEERIVCEYPCEGMNMIIFNGFIIISGKSPHSKVLKKSYENSFLLGSPYTDEEHVVSVLQ